MDKKDIMPFHLFHHHGNHYVINIESMRTSSVDKITAEALEVMVTKPEIFLPCGMEEALKKLGLLSECGEKKINTAKKEPTSIVNMALFVTQSCNLKCVYCYGEAGEYGGGGSMEEKTAYQAVDWLIEQSGKVKKINIAFFGGEPFINFSLIKKVVKHTQKRAHALEKKVCFSVTTNATLLDDEKIAFIKEHNIHVMISIDGPREIQDMQRPFANGKGSYDTILPKIKKLLEVLPETRAHAVLVDDTKTHIIKNALQEIGFSEVSILPASASLFKGESGNIKRDRELDGALKEVEQEAEAWLRHTKNRDSESLKNLMLSAQLSQALMSFLHNKKKQHPCGAGIKFVGVSCSGDVYLCHRFVGMDNYKLGSVFSKDLDREKYRESPLTQMEACAECFARYYCVGGCKHDNAGSCDSAFKPSEEMCQLKRREVELAAAIVGMFDDKDRAFLNEHKVFPPKPCPLDF